MKNLKLILKGLTLGMFTTSVVNAQSQVNAKGKCAEIKSYLNDKNISYDDNISSCVVNDKDEIIELSIQNQSLSEEDVNKLLSYDSINKLYYCIYYGEVNYDDYEKYGPEFNVFPTNLKDLPNLNELYLHYYRKEQIAHTYTTIYTEKIKENVLKDLEIKSLTLNGINFDSSTLKEINSLSNLESLSIINGNLSEVNLDDLKNNNKLTELYIGYNDLNYYDGIYNPNKLNISNVKTLKKLTISHFFLDQNLVDELASLTFLEELNMDSVYFGYSVDKQLKLPFDNLSNLSKLTVVFVNSRDYEDEAILSVDLKIPKNLKSLVFGGMDITKDNMDVISSATTLKELYITCNDCEIIPDTEKINNLKNLECLKIFGHYPSEEININFNTFNLKKLYLANVQLSESFDEDIMSYDQLEELSIVECTREEPLNLDNIGNLKKLNTFILSSDRYDDEFLLNDLPKSFFDLTEIKTLILEGQRNTFIPEELGNFKNLETLHIRGENVKSEIPQSLNELTKLKDVELTGMLSGKTLTNESIENCYYSGYIRLKNLCKPKDMPCLKYQDIKECEDSDNIPVSSDGQCGKDHGRCPFNYCCKDGKCGTGEDYCYVSNGCQNEYSSCIDQCDEINIFINEVNTGLDIFDRSDIDDCEVNNKGEVISFKYYSSDETGKIIEKIASYNTITTLYYFDDKSLNVKGFTKLTNLKDFTIGFIGMEEEEEKLSFDSNDLKGLKNLSSLYISGIPLTQKNLDGLAELTNLESLTLSYNSLESSNLNFDFLKKLTNLQSFYYEGREKKTTIEEIPSQLFDLSNLKNLTIINSYNDKGLTSIPKEIANLKNLEILNFYYNKIKTIPKEIGALSNLKVLNLQFNSVTNLPSELGNLENLEELNVGFNEIDDVIPESLNNLKKLKSVHLGGNENLRGKTLTNPTIEECFYNFDKKLCVAKYMDCMKDYIDDDIFPSKNCTDIDTTTTTTIKKTTTIKTTTTTTTTEKSTSTPYDYRCGQDYGKCKYGLCCSKYGHCGGSAEYCAISKGCQSEFGECFNDHDYKCGEGRVRCPEGYCCSEYGYCGKSSDYCAVSKGCQSTYGECKNDIDYGKCGEGYGKCRDGYCCSTYGYCGKTDSYCAISKGCQSDYGLCKNDVHGKCGPENGYKCPSGYCCSKYGWCGSTSDYCAVTKGCQVDYGRCEDDAEGKCGPNNRYKCPNGQCCSKYGYCGKGEAYCGFGCQSEFGDCN